MSSPSQALLLSLVPRITSHIDAATGFIDGKNLSANQLEFINLVVDHLTEHGLVMPDRLYQSPFTDITPQGPEGLFPSEHVDGLMRALDAVRATAFAA